MILRPWLAVVFLLVPGIVLGDELPTSTPTTTPETAPMAIEVEAIELVAEPATAWPILRVHLRNASDVAIAGWAFEVEAAGRLVDGYDDVLVLHPAEPGERVTLDLFRLESPPRPFQLRLSLVEAWAAEWVTGECGDQDGEWRFIAPLDGSPVTVERVVD